MRERGTTTDVADTVAFFGGVSRWRELRVVHPARLIRRSVEAGAVVRATRGRYLLPSTVGQLATAQSRSAVLSHVSAAVHHGWKVKVVPDAAWITVPCNRCLRVVQRIGVNPRWSDLGTDDVRHGVTTPLRTVLDCARALPFDEALAVADSALRARDITRAELEAAAAAAHGPGSRPARRVAAHADGRAANPFESVLRALTLQEGFDLTPQLELSAPGLFAIVDWVRWALRTWRTVRTGGVPEDPPHRSR